MISEHEESESDDAVTTAFDGIKRVGTSLVGLVLTAGKPLASMFITLFSVSVLGFVLFDVMPGGPADYVRATLAQNNPGMRPQQIERMVQVYTNIDPSKPIHLKYIDYMTSLLQGDLGQSMVYQRPAMDLLAPAIPWTVFLMSFGLLLNFLLGISLGSIMAYKEGGRFDKVMTGWGILTGSIPYYLAALIFLAYLGYAWTIFPVRGAYASGVQPGYSSEFIGSILYHATLPLLSIVATSVGARALSMRGNCISILGSDYLRVARIRGLPESRIALRYVLRNGVLPAYTGLLISIGALMGGAVVLETIFIYPGVGYIMLTALEARDHILLMGGFLLITTATIVGVYLADATYSLLDPRINAGEAQ